jgi:CheY-like chemotaxis protein
MHKHWIRVLLVEEDEGDYRRTLGLLEGSLDPLVELDRVAGRDEALVAVTRREHDLYLFDHRPGGLDGVGLVRAAREAGCRRPIFLLTGLADRRVDLAATAAGAAGFLLKHEITASSLERAIRYALGHGADRAGPSARGALPTPLSTAARGSGRAV